LLRCFLARRSTCWYDVSHNTCKIEEHIVDGQRKRLFMHRKGATRAFGPGHPDLPERFRVFGQPVLIGGGTMGTASYVLVGTREGSTRAFGSSCHGAGRRLSRHAAVKQFAGRQVIDELGRRGILVRSRSTREVAEEAQVPTRTSAPSSRPPSRRACHEQLHGSSR
jgi:tRNA-splicing ligase RtcB (3'-phosphate/5'-hydroxy nucleic acid ligase)